MESYHQSEERKRELIDVRDIIDERIRELERRVNESFQKAIDSLEKFINLSVKSRSDALGIAINKMENGSTACEDRCSKQVKEFYVEINQIKKDNVGRDFLVDDLTEDLVKINNEFKDFKLSVNADVKSLQTSLSEFNNWKETFWVRNFVKTIAVTVFVTQILIKIITILYEKIPALQTLSP